MTLKERFLATLRFQETDRPWRLETIGFWKETIQRWHGEGLPRYIFPEIAMSYFGFDYLVPVIISAGGNPGFFPPFMPAILRREGGHEIVRDFGGNVLKRFRNRASAIPQHISSPVETMDDFRRLRWRLNPDFPGRCDNPLWDGAAAFAKLMKAPLCIQIDGLFAFHRDLMGVEKLMYAYFDQPELIHAFGRAWTRLTRGVVRNFSKKTDVTGIVFWEDMCGKSGPLVSPRIFREFISPYYKQVIGDAKGCGVEGFIVDTDGDCTHLIPLFIDLGINMLYPFEVQAGMDIRKVRAEWGNKLAIMGGLDKRVLERTEEEIEAEVMSKVPQMLESGGYVPAIDHAVHPDVPLKNFRFFLEFLRSDTRFR